MKTRSNKPKQTLGIAFLLLVINLLIVLFSRITAQVSITKPILDFGYCSLPSNYFLLNDIVIQETNKSDFQVGATKNMVISAPSGFEFQPTTGTASAVNGGNLGGVTMVVASTQLTIQFTCNSVSKFDVLTLSGLQIRAINSAGSGNLVRTGGNAVINGLAVNTTLTNSIVSTALSAGTFRTKSNTNGLLDWSQSSTWECGVVPPNDGTANVIIRAYSGPFSPNNTVYFSGSPDIHSIVLENGANFSPPATTNTSLVVRGDFIIQNGAFLRQRNWVQNGLNTIKIAGNFNNNGEMITDGSNNAYDVNLEFNGTNLQYIYGSGIFQMLGNGNGKSSLIVSNSTGVVLQSNFSTQSNFGDPGEVVVNGYLLFGSETTQLTGIGSLVLNGKTTLKASTFNLHYALSGSKTITNTSTIEYTHPNSSISSTNIPSLFLNNLQVTVGINGGVALIDNLIVNGTLTMNSGVVKTGTNSIQLGSSLSSLGSLDYHAGFITGRLRRWFFGTNSGQNSGLFPMAESTGKWKRFVQIEYTDPTSGGDLTAEWIELPMGFNFSNSLVQTTCDGQFPISKTASGYWSVTPSNGITVNETKKYQITLSAEAINDFMNDCHITAVKKSGILPWDQSGIHIDNIGNAVSPIIKRSEAMGWSNWGFAGEDTPLPIELVEFYCFKTANEVSINWTTHSEFNNDHFELFKSDTSLNWKLIKSIPAAGISNENISYSVKDNSISNGCYYLLKQIDLDGTETTFGPIQFQELEKSDFTLESTPNPSNGVFVLGINNPGLQCNGSIRIMNAFGEQVYNSSLTVNHNFNSFEISLCDFNSGIYYVIVELNNNLVRIIKQQIVVD